MADINVEMLKEKLYPAAKALFIIGETLVDVSKQHISPEKAIDKIRSYMSDTDVIGSRYRVDLLIEKCEDKRGEWTRNYLGKWVGLEPLEVNYPDCCDDCSNNPKNGGSGICNCTLPYMQNPTVYNTTVPIDDFCMTATNSTGVYVLGNERLSVNSSTNRIAEAVERTQKYIRKD